MGSNRAMTRPNARVTTVRYPTIAAQIRNERRSNDLVTQITELRAANPQATDQSAVCWSCQAKNRLATNPMPSVMAVAGPRARRVTKNVYAVAATLKTDNPHFHACPPAHVEKQEPPMVRAEHDRPIETLQNLRQGRVHAR